MKANDIFVSAIEPAGKFCVFLEFDGETSYFYLGTVSDGDLGKVIDALHIESKAPDFKEKDVEIKWAEKGSIAGLLIKGQLVAAFDAIKKKKYGGNIKRGKAEGIPSSILSSLAI
jgi:hypothetical protein